MFGITPGEEEPQTYRVLKKAVKAFDNRITPAGKVFLDYVEKMSFRMGVQPNYVFYLLYAKKSAYPVLDAKQYECLRAVVLLTESWDQMPDFADFAEPSEEEKSKAVRVITRSAKFAEKMVLSFGSALDEITKKFKKSFFRTLKDKNIPTNRQAAVFCNYVEKTILSYPMWFYNSEALQALMVALRKIIYPSCAI